MSNIVWHPASIGFGLYSFNFKKIGDQSEEGDAAAMTLINIGGWFPIIGAISGIAHVALAVSHKQKEHENVMRRVFLVRGFSEIFGIGPIVMIIDIGVTIARLCIPEPNSSARQVTLHPKDIVSRV